MKSKNIFGEPLIECSSKPLTGFFRDGCCKTNEQDTGEHTVCIIASEEFLHFSKSVGNDLSTPIPQYEFEGVKPGDRWCLCAKRWIEAYRNGFAPKIVLEATNETLLEYVAMDVLISFAYRKETQN
ncbi:MAG: DUF2237 domain-containing protein [Bacteroidales bacterium]|nr:DUF2237 domain-containing protein [Bacteroidales bacterium]